MGLADSGFDARACLDFDLSVLEFGEAFERAAQATKEVPAPERSRKRPATVQVPRHGEADLRRFLGLDDDGDGDEGGPAAGVEEARALASEGLAGGIDWSRFGLE